MKTEAQVHKLLHQERDKESQRAASRTLDRLMCATVDAMLGLVSIDSIMFKYFEASGFPYDYGHIDLPEGDLQRVREYLTYIYARERVPV